MKLIVAVSPPGVFRDDNDGQDVVMEPADQRTRLDHIWASFQMGVGFHFPLEIEGVHLPPVLNIATEEQLAYLDHGGARANQTLLDAGAVQFAENIHLLLAFMKHYGRYPVFRVEGDPRSVFQENTLAKWLNHVCAKLFSDNPHTQYVVAGPSRKALLALLGIQGNRLKNVVAADFHNQFPLLARYMHESHKIPPDSDRVGTGKIVIDWLRPKGGHSPKAQYVTPEHLALLKFLGIPNDFGAIQSAKSSSARRLNKALDTVILILDGKGKAISKACKSSAKYNSTYVFMRDIRRKAAPDALEVHMRALFDAAEAKFHKYDAVFDVVVEAVDAFMGDYEQLWDAISDGDLRRDEVVEMIGEDAFETLRVFYAEVRATMNTDAFDFMDYRLCDLMEVPLGECWFTRVLDS